MSRQPGAVMSEKQKALSVLFRALARHASDDKSRPSHLHHVRAWRVGDVVRFESTDGHALVRVDVPAPWFDDAGVAAPDGYYVGQAAATLLSVGSAPVPAPSADFYWPHTDQVIPAETLAPGAAAGFDPVLLSSVLDTIAKIAGAFGGKKHDPVRMQLGQGGIDPARITRQIAAWYGSDCHKIDVVAVVMPCRL